VNFQEEGNYSRYTIWSTRFGVVELKKDFWTLRVENLIRDIVMVDGGWRKAWRYWSSTLELEANIDVKRLALEEEVHEGEPELFFRG